MDDNSTRIAAADWDAPDTWKVSYPDDTIVPFTPAEFLRGEWWRPDIDCLVVENAHLKERNGFSVAQVYEEAELEQLALPAPIKLFPGKLARRYDVYTEGDKLHDSLGLRKYLENDTKMLRCLKNFQPPSEYDKSSWEWRDKIRDDVGAMINIMRVKWRGVAEGQLDQFEQIAHMRKLVDSFYDELPEDVIEQFQLRKGKVKPLKGRTRFGSVTQVFTVYALVFDMDGNLRTNDRGEFYGVDAAVNKVVGLNHSHMPNAARANFMHFGLKPKYRNAADPQAAKAEFTKNIKCLVRAFRDAGLREQQKNMLQYP